MYINFDKLLAIYTVKYNTNLKIYIKVTISVLKILFVQLITNLYRNVKNSMK